MHLFISGNIFEIYVDYLSFFIPFSSNLFMLDYYGCGSSWSNRISEWAIGTDSSTGVCGVMIFRIRNIERIAITGKPNLLKKLLGLDAYCGLLGTVESSSRSNKGVS